MRHFQKRFMSFSVTKGLSLALSLGLLVNGVSPVFSASPNVLTGDVRVTVNPSNIKASLPIPGGSRKVTMSFHGMSIQDALRALGKKGGFNVLIDESVTGEISVDLNNVTIQEALETIKAYGNLVYAMQGSNLMVTDATSEKAQAFRKSSTRIFPLKNANASIIANTLNNTLFADQMNNGGAGGAGGAGGGGGGGGAGGVINAPVTADFHTNSLIVVGQPSDIQAVAKYLEVLDTPRQSKTWRLSHANVLDVATILASSIFNEGVPSLSTNASGGAGGGNTVGETPTQVRVVADNVQDGTGALQSSQSGGGGGGQGGGISNALTLRSRVKAVQSVSVSSTGPIILPDTRLNTLTLMGTAEQIAMAEAMIPTLDRKVPQVVLETALVEMSEIGQRELGFNFGYNNGGFKLGSNNNSNTGIPTSASTPMENLFQWSTSPISRSQNFYYRINALINQSKAKMLANPSIITSSDNEAVVSIVDEIVRSVTLTQSALTAPTATVNIGEAGIVLNLLPKIGADNTISLRVRPTISTISDTRSGLGGLVTLLSKREVLTQNVQLRDGETFILGGLMQNTNKEAVFRNPGLSNLPIVGALARNSTLNKKRTELVIMITPHIVHDESSVTRGLPGQPGSGMVPATFSGNAADQRILPVSYNSDERPNALPAREKPHVINSAMNGEDPLENRDLAQPSPRPSGALLPDELTPAPQSARIKPAEKDAMVPVSYRSEAPAVSTRKKAPDHAVVVAPPRPDTSDAAMRAIMEKFNQPY